MKSDAYDMTNNRALLFAAIGLFLPGPGAYLGALAAWAAWKNLGAGKPGMAKAITALVLGSFDVTLPIWLPVVVVIALT